jgi:hypothetical protein
MRIDPAYRKITADEFPAMDFNIDSRGKDAFWPDTMFAARDQQPDATSLIISRAEIFARD